MDFRVDAPLAHAARDELRNLAAEIDDENAVGQSSRGPLFKAIPYANTEEAATAATQHPAEGGKAGPPRQDTISRRNAQFICQIAKLSAASNETHARYGK
ncbi:hypothetical protein HYPDE_27113 [Hyphomicrobium denitrificans 1NES1]|uniref:Uncharacterized protein n=1 Tax=Hyphomicrobium denitrificans 1NES1 TaxID=670307 RepID=N0B4G1_9HYPH|nr:hypothetical protein HYPDE_27113 [Hyphomicrobium denitrificans 1NES1]